MPSPFPGMAPYIEACGLWGDFPDRLIGELERTLAAALPPRYVTRIRERTYIEWSVRGKTRRKRVPSCPMYEEAMIALIRTPGVCLAARAAICLTLVTMVAGCGSDEPLYLGKTFAQWQAQLQAESPQARLAAVEAMTAMGTRAVPAVPVLTKALHDADAGVRLAAVEVMFRLVQDGHAAPATLAALFADQDAAVRAAAAAAIGRIGDSQGQFRAGLVTMLDDPAAGARLAAAQAIQAIDPRAQQPLPVLSQLLSAPDETIRGEAARSLAPFGAEARDAAPRLVQLLEDPGPLVREGASLALAQMGPEAGVGRAALLKALANPATPSEALAEARALLASGADAKEAVPLLRKQIEKFGRVTGFPQAMEEIIAGFETTH